MNTLLFLLNVYIKNFENSKFNYPEITNLVTLRNQACSVHYYFLLAVRIHNGSLGCRQPGNGYPVG